MADAARASYRGYLSHVSRTIGLLTKAITESDVAKVRAGVTDVNNAIVKYMDSFEALSKHIVDDDKSLDVVEARYAETLNLYSQVTSKADTWLNTSSPAIRDIKMDVSDTPSDTSTSTPIQDFKGIVDALSVPKAEILVFDGDPLLYQVFLSTFNEAVGDKAHMTKPSKLTRLLNFTKGPAYDSISSCALLGEEGYDKALSILADRFGNKHLISQRILLSLKSGKGLSKATEIRQFGDELKTAHAALAKLGMISEVENQNFIHDLNLRLPNFVQRRWRREALKVKADKQVYPKFESFVKFVGSVALEANDAVYGWDKGKPTHDVQVHHGSCRCQCTGRLADEHDAEVLVHDTSVSPVASKPNCTCCQKAVHPLYTCDKFKSLSVSDRWSVVKASQVCFCCLNQGCRISLCPRKRVCGVNGCNRHHSRLLHFDRSSSSEKKRYAHVHTVHTGQPPVSPGSGVPHVPVAPSTQISYEGDSPCGQGSISVSNASTGTSIVRLPVLPIEVDNLKRDSGTAQQVLALLDSGSTSTFVTQGLVDKLKAHGAVVRYQLYTVSQTSNCTSRIVSISILNGKREPFVLHNVFVIPEIPSKYVGYHVDTLKFPHLKDIPFPEWEESRKAELLIGMDNAYLVLPLQIIRGRNERIEPFGLLTHLGWTVAGPVGSPTLSAPSCHFTSLEEQVDKWWQVESDVGSIKAMSVNDKRVLDLWDKTCKFEEGHYSLPIPWREGFPAFPDNFFMAKCRLDSLLKKLHSNGTYDKYEENIHTMLSKGYAEPVPDGDKGSDNTSVWYLPHHAVVRDDKPGKVRVVFDCAASQAGVGLNTSCLSGPDLVNKLLCVLLRFRQYRYAVMADIEAMYLQVKIPLDDRDALRFLWYENDRLMHYRMCAHLFGGVWCASSSTYALRRVLTDFPTSDLVKDVVDNSCYVDDVLDSRPDKDQVREVITDVPAAVSKGGFNLTKFTANDPELLSDIPVENRASQVKEILPEMFSKALGIQWEVCSDTFHYVFKPTPSMSITRRFMLSQVSSLYDPLGLIAPIIFRGKQLFQDATRLKLGWDDPVPPAMATKWSKWVASLEDLTSLKFDRCVIPPGFAGGDSELHHFCDGSTVGYGACTYVRTTNAEGAVHVTLLMAKSRVAPLNALSVPRLELSSAVMAVKLDEVARRELTIPLKESTFWSDSEIILDYISNSSCRFQIFVANRVSAIMQGSHKSQWHHIAGVDNPADVASRGCLSNGLPASWFAGAWFLKEPRSSWPVESPRKTHAELASRLELRSHNVVLETRIENSPLDVLIKHYSCYYRLQKAVAWLRRCLSKLRGREIEQGPLSASELRRAELVLISHVQHDAYPEEIASLKSQGRVSVTSDIFTLNPMMDEELIVVKGRLRHSKLPSQAKHPFVLPRDHDLSRLIVTHSHNVAHLGVEWTFTRLRAKFWIIGAKNLIKQVKRQCMVCRKLYARPMEQHMADLPAERVTPGLSCFENTGLDFFGPFYVKVGRGTAKRYGVVFTCFTTRAVHVEKIDSLESDAFLNGLFRFIARRGSPSKVFSDNGTNIVGGESELTRSLKSLDRSSIVKSARRRGIDWSFNPPHASHHGGVWERMIGTIRRVLSALLNECVRLTDDVLHTFLCEVEGVINSRPITSVSSDLDEPEPLTPNHLLLLRGSSPLPWGEFLEGETYRRRWKHVQVLVDAFWKRWTSEYLTLLQLRPKWQSVRNNLKQGSLVLMIDELKPRGSWPLGLVTAVKSSSDGLVRSATIKTKDGSYVRPITKLVRLEGELGDADQNNCVSK